MLTCDEYITPASLDEAFAAMDAHRGNYRVIAGATDTYPWAREGRAGDVHINALIDVSKIPALTKIEITDQRVRMGAATPIQRFLDNPALGRALPALPRCAVWFADDQLRALATIGGNIVNASPAADATPCLMAHETVVQLRSAHGRRAMPLSEFITGPSKTRLAEGELLVSVECDALPGYGGSFEKVGHRRSLVISLACVATAMKLDADGRAIEDVRLGLAGVCPVPQRLREIEAFLRGRSLSAETIQKAAEMPLDLVQSRTRREYRRDILRGFMVRGLITAAKRTGADPSVLPNELEAAYA